MSSDIRKVKDMDGLIAYFSNKLEWRIDIDDFDDIDEIAYDFSAEDIGLKEEAFARIKSLRQLPPLVDGQKWGIFCVEFDSKKFEVTALRKILSGLIPTKRNSAEHAVWNQKDLLFLCSWGTENERTIGVAHFQDKDSGLPQIKMISCAPSVEDFTQIQVFEKRLEQLKWPNNYLDYEKWASDWSEAFVTGYRQTIRDAATLTSQLAKEAQNIRNRIMDTLAVESANGYVHLLFEKFKNTLIHDMKATEFADMYAQTVVYGLFSARCMDNTQEDFSAEEAVECIPLTNPFLKYLMQECLGARSGSKLSFDELEISNVVELLQCIKTEEIINDFNRQTGGGKEDPVIHFYEDFLSEYDKKQKVQRGVYYTPQPIVAFMVDAVDSILKKEFKFKSGLASVEKKSIEVQRLSKKKIDGLLRTITVKKQVPAIQMIDPATGTGTFIRQAILKIFENFKNDNSFLSGAELNKAWNEYVPANLLPRVNAFELMMAPYAVAHMKLAMVLKDTGYDFGSDSRLQVYLTNSLEKAGNSDIQLSLWSDPLSAESIAANVAKKNNGINVIIGNPPYSSISSNKSEWITELMANYKYEPGGKEKLQEKKQWLDDDYVKFLRWAQIKTEQSGASVVAFINPHGWLENGGFRGMRWSLLKTFDEIYILNLHGNSKKQERCPDGSKDENVFDIQQGVCINIFVKKEKSQSDSLAKVYYKDLYGKRDYKYSFLNNNSFECLEWQELSPDTKMYYLIPKDFSGSTTYYSGFSLIDFFPMSSQGLMSGNDKMVMDPSFSLASEKAQQFVNQTPSILKELYKDVKTPKNWKYELAKTDLMSGYSVEKILYRPFQYRYTAYTGNSCGWHWRPRTEVMSQFVNRDNLGLILTRIVQQGKEYSHAFVSDCITDKGVLSSKDNAFIFPLYCFDSVLGKNAFNANINTQIVDAICEKCGLEYNIKPKDKLSGGKTVGPYDLFCYVYGILYLPSYRKVYREFLMLDFPIVPYPKSAESFYRLSNYGDSLISLHTGRKELFEETTCFDGGDYNVRKIRFESEKIYINDSSCFGLVPDSVWGYKIGGYQPLQQILKEKKGAELSVEEVDDYIKIINILKGTKLLESSVETINVITDV